MANGGTWWRENRPTKRPPAGMYLHVHTQRTLTPTSGAGRSEGREIGDAGEPPTAARRHIVAWPKTHVRGVSHAPPPLAFSQARSLARMYIPPANQPASNGPLPPKGVGRKGGRRTAEGGRLTLSPWDFRSSEKGKGKERLLHMVLVYLSRVE